MAAKKRKKKKKVIRFELTPVGFSGLAVVCFCVFLWMFLFGVWAGQTILLPATGEFALERPAASTSGPSLAGVVEQNREAESSGLVEFVRTGIKKNFSGASSNDAAASLFSLQVDTIDDIAQAREAVLRWQARGHDAFLLEPATERDLFWRIFVGRFVKLSDANSQAALLEKEEGVKVYITLLSADLFPLT